MVPRVRTTRPASAFADGFGGQARGEVKNRCCARRPPESHCRESPAVELSRRLYGCRV